MGAKLRTLIGNEGSRLMGKIRLSDALLEKADADGTFCQSCGDAALGDGPYCQPCGSYWQDVDAGLFDLYEFENNYTDGER